MNLLVVCDTNWAIRTGTTKETQFKVHFKEVTSQTRRNSEDNVVLVLRKSLRSFGLDEHGSQGHPLGVLTRTFPYETFSHMVSLDPTLVLYVPRLLYRNKKYTSLSLSSPFPPFLFLILLHFSVDLHFVKILILDRRFILWDKSHSLFN